MADPSSAFLLKVPASGPVQPRYLLRVSDSITNRTNAKPLHFYKVSLVTHLM